MRRKHYKSSAEQQATKQKSIVHQQQTSKTCKLSVSCEQDNYNVSIYIYEQPADDCHPNHASCNTLCYRALINDRDSDLDGT